MPRTARAAVGGYCYHAGNRGNHRAPVFHDADDYAAFARLLRQAAAHAPLRVLGWCLRPDHCHAVLWPEHHDDLANGRPWLLTTHALRYNRAHHRKGHVWQGRLHFFAIEPEEHWLTVVRSVERHPLRANLVARAQDRPWSSLAERQPPPLCPFLHPGPLALPGEWVEHVNAPQTAIELDRQRQSVRRGCPYGTQRWVVEAAVR